MLDVDKETLMLRKSFMFLAFGLAPALFGASALAVCVDDMVAGRRCPTNCPKTKADGTYYVNLNCKCETANSSGECSASGTCSAYTAKGLPTSPAGDCGCDKIAPKKANEINETTVIIQTNASN